MHSLIAEVSLCNSCRGAFLIAVGFLCKLMSSNSKIAVFFKGNYGTDRPGMTAIVNCKI